MTASSQHLISSFCRTCLQQLRCESSYNLFATPGLAKKLSVCTSLSIELQDGFPDNICGVCYTRLNEIHDFQEQCVDAVQKFQDMVRLVCVNKVKPPLVFEKSHNEQQDTDEIRNEIVISDDTEDININSENSMKRIKECEQVVLGAVGKVEIEETQIVQDNFNKIGVKPQSKETTHTKERKYECDTCEKKYTRFLNLKDHKNIHTGEKPYVCKTCGKEFSHRNYLRQHEMIHTKIYKVIHVGEKPHKCEICAKTFSRSMTLSRHKIIHSGEKPYGCKFCGKRFPFPGHMKAHEMKHTGEKPHKCKTCGKSYSRLRSLRYHEVTHTGEKLFACKTCGKDFSHRYSLNLHERRHSMKKPFKCEICLKGFINNSELKRHKKTYTGESPFICETCGKGFKSKQFLQIHQNKCMHVTFNESEVSDKSKFKNEIEHGFPVSSDMDEQEFISISFK